MVNTELTEGVSQGGFAGAGNGKNLPVGYTAMQPHAQETLAKSQKRFRYAFLTSPDSVAIIRAKDKIYTEINEMFSLFLGYGKEEIVGKSFFEIPAWHDREEQQNLLADTERRGPVINRETRFIDAEGVVKTGLLSMMKMPLDQELHFVLAIRNIDALRKVEEALEKSEARYRELFSNMSNGVAVFEAKNDGEEFVFIDFNRAAERIEQVKREDVLDTFKRVFKTGKPEYHPVEIYKNGELKLFKENYIYRLPAGEIVDVYDDITERKLAESKLLIYQEKLQSLASELSLVEERERRSIATDLHDQIGQTLSVIKMSCFALRNDLRSPDHIRQVDEIKRLIAQTIRDTRFSMNWGWSQP